MEKWILESVVSRSVQRKTTIVPYEAVKQAAAPFHKPQKSRQMEEVPRQEDFHREI
jgi:hypothetical protein